MTRWSDPRALPRRPYDHSVSSETTEMRITACTIVRPDHYTFGSQVTVRRSMRKAIINDG